jgi:hypothetical protein
MAERESGLRGLLEEVQRFGAPGEGYLWHQNITGVRLDPHQLLYYECFEKNPRVIVKGSRRIRKSYPVASWFLREAAKKPFSEVNIFAPALEQSKRNVRYMAGMIMQSPVLLRMLERRSGGVSIGKESITFRNGSVIQAKGQASSVDGLGSTHIWLEELDDMDWDTLQTRIMPTGAQLKNNYDYGVIGQCQTIASGTIKGMFNLYRLEHPDALTPASARFVTAPVFDCHDGVAFGVISEDYIDAQRAIMTPEQFARTYLCLYTESKNFFPTRYLHRCTATHVRGVEFVVNLPRRTARYRPHGIVVCGLDFAGQGQQEGKSSKTSVVYLDVIEPGLAAVIWCEEFDALAPPQQIRERLRELNSYFRPARGVGDSYDTTLIHNICEDAYDLKIHRLDPKKYGHGDGKEGWESWWIIPVIYSGPRRHQMYMRTQRAVYERGLLFPPVIRPLDGSEHETKTVQRLLDQMEGIVSTPTQGGYDKYAPTNKIMGDDLVDALVGAMEAATLQKPKSPAFGGSAGGTGDDFADLTFHKPAFHVSEFKKPSGGSASASRMVAHFAPIIKINGRKYFFFAA